MSDRNQDQNFLEMLRELRERVKVLETTQNNAVKRNDIRLSDTIVRADSPNDQLCLENLVTRQIVCIGAQLPTDPTQAQWSYSGDLAGHAGEFSPAFLVERDTIARQIIVAQRCGDTFSGTVVLCVSFDCGVNVRVTLNGSQEFSVTEINIPLVENDSISMELIDGSDANNISVFVRFGTPAVSENTGNDNCAV